eukprot:comp24330_c0_seq1/m.60138 comp24330_c0_seq1/g.60138  ORF comp24330_c0_seq1/g.60138 comp24330_c0_seq1/m.60138 type:complete len:158 (-) comp24330_c0_seq1:202-675(-)
MRSFAFAVFFALAVFAAIACAEPTKDELQKQLTETQALEGAAEKARKNTQDEISSAVSAADKQSEAKKNQIKTLGADVDKAKAQIEALIRPIEDLKKQYEETNEKLRLLEGKYTALRNKAVNGDQEDKTPGAAPNTQFEGAPLEAATKDELPAGQKK